MQDPLDLVEEVFDQGLGVLEPIGPAWIVLRTMPVICGLAAVLKPRALGRHIVRIVEADQSRPIRRVKRKRIGKLCGRFLVASPRVISNLSQ